MTQARSALSACACEASSEASVPPSSCIFAFGGYDGSTFLNSVEVYEPARDQWTVLAEPQSLTQPRSGHAVVACIAPDIGGGSRQLPISASIGVNPV